jgi:DNA-binding CsgD family transcriptional regulator
MRADAKQRASDKLAQLSRRGLDLATYWRQANEVIAAAVRHYEAPCWYTFDPASLLVTSHFHEGLPEIPREWLVTEYYEDDVYKLADVARSQRGITTLYEATAGDPAKSKRWHHNVAYGGDQELIAGLRTRDGAVWGALALYRERGEPLFDSDELAFLRSVSGYLAEGARRALLVGEATDREWPDAPGIIIISERGEVESMTPGLDRWLDELPDGDPTTGRLPSAVLAVAGRALQPASAHPPGDLPFARVLTHTGAWAVLHGATLISDGSRRVAVIVEPAHPARISPLLMSAYGLTERERDITRLVLRGYSTTEIAGELVLSAHTVQQHLKNVFEKTGVRSRRDLMGKVFFSYYEPRVRDNEHRVALSRPLRGGPMSPANRTADCPPER